MPLTPADIRNKRFSTSRLRPGYVRDDVDLLLRRVEATLTAVANGQRGGDLITASDVMRSQFRTTLVRSGYDEEEVDEFLDRVAESLRAAGLYAASVNTGQFKRTGVPNKPAGTVFRLRPEDIRNKGFTTTRLRSGYVEDEVDAFLDRAEATISAALNGADATEPLSATEVRAVRFTSARLRSGYAEDEVDQFLDLLVDELEHHGLH
ncbi:DivIVA domain-containing protein [Nocardiopsis ansamitocini]|nr:DivIVA domain-containing protein [Nocardiopsis ansamitocini]